MPDSEWPVSDEVEGTESKGTPPEWLVEIDPGLKYHEYQIALRDERRSRWDEKAPAAPAWSGNQLLQIPPPDWLLRPVLQEKTLAALVGGFGTYKSFLAIDIAMSLATGLVWEIMSRSHVDRRPRDVVFVEAEGFDTIVTRSQSWLQHRGYDPFQLPTTLHVPRDIPNLWADHDRPGGSVERVMKLAVENNASLVVVDTLHASSAGGDTNSPHDMNQMVHSLRRMRDEADVTVLVVHHYNKSGDVGGSNVLPAACDTILEMRPSNKERPRRLEHDTVKVEMTKQRRAPRRFLGVLQPRLVRFRDPWPETPADMVDHDGASLVLVRENSKADAEREKAERERALRDRIIRACEVMEPVPSKTKLANKVSGRVQDTFIKIDEMVDDGELFVWEDGSYNTTPEPPEAL